MTKTVKATLSALIALIAVAALVAISYLIIPKWVKDTITLLLLLPPIFYGLGKYFAWCLRYWRRWRQQAEGDAAGEGWPHSPGAEEAHDLCDRHDIVASSRRCVE